MLILGDFNMPVDNTEKCRASEPNNLLEVLWLGNWIHPNVFFCVSTLCLCLFLPLLHLEINVDHVNPGPGTNGKFGALF